MIYTSNPSSISPECRKDRSLVQVALCRERKSEGEKREREKNKDRKKLREQSEKLRRGEN